MIQYSCQFAFVWFLAAVFSSVFVTRVSAQTGGFSAGKSLHELQLSIHRSAPIAFSPNLLQHEKLTFTDAFLHPAPKQGIFLPQWSAEDLPFFCKIEHDWAKTRQRIPLKFRLGSVDYVDWLEGKSWDKLRY
jgi:hypothetical protein